MHNALYSSAHASVPIFPRFAGDLPLKVSELTALVPEGFCELVAIELFVSQHASAMEGGIHLMAAFAATGGPATARLDSSTD
jgi:hypothetical protein